MPEVYRSAVPATMTLKRDFTMREVEEIILQWLAANAPDELGYEQVSLHISLDAPNDGYSADPGDVVVTVQEKYILND